MTIFYYYSPVLYHFGFNDFFVTLFEVLVGAEIPRFPPFQFSSPLYLL